MEYDSRSRRVRGALYLGIAVIGVTAAGTVAARAAGETGLAALVTAVTCATNSACVSGTNTSTGPGVVGTSAKGYGVVGTASNGFGVRAVSKSSDGMLGSSTTGQAGVAGTTPSSYGVYGYTTSSSGGIGVYGTSASGYGVYGRTTSGNGYGVLGIETGGIGVYGASTSGYAIEGFSQSGTALSANVSGSGTAVNAASSSGYGVIAHSNGSVAVYGRNTSGNGADFQGTYIGLLGRSPVAGYPLVLTDPSGNNVFYVDGSGNVSYKGGLFAFSPTRNGAAVKAFTPKTTSPTVEETGTAQLAGGVADVRLDPSFAASIDPNVAYRVFVTPNGDTRGLFVATKSSSGFVVREAQSGRANVSFDYRIVATAFGQSRERMAPLGATLGPRAAVPVIPTAAMRPATPLP